jgi:hypothetical protein
MLRKLVSIANKLDSLGLTKEADLIDREIIRLAGPLDRLKRFTARTEESPSPETIEEVVAPSASETPVEVVPVLTEEQRKSVEKLVNGTVKKIESKPDFTRRVSEKERNSLRTSFTKFTLDPTQENRSEVEELIKYIELFEYMDYPDQPTVRDEIDPKSYYVFRYQTPESKKSIWLFDKKFSSEEDANDYINNEEEVSDAQMIVFKGFKVQRMMFEGQDVYNSGAKLRLSSDAWKGSVSPETQLLSGSESPGTRQKGAE